jgi:hypothetical protein
MQLHKHLHINENLNMTRNSSKKTMQTRSITPVTSTKTLPGEGRKQRFPIRVECKKPSTPCPPSRSPYVLMRNGVTFLYTPGQTEGNFPSLISAFGTPLRGSKIRGRFEAGNMFAVHSENSDERISPSISLKPRSYLTMRSKWK